MTFIKIFFQPKDKNLIFTIYLSLILSMVLVVGRTIYSGSLFYMFLIWNLFLAFVPFAASMVINHRKEKSGVFTFSALFGFWLLFFPNAPYILTDMVHLKYRHGVPFWYDMILLLSFAWNGLLLGYISLFKVQDVLEYKFGKKIAWAGVITSIILSAFGVYIGRYMRWNSWDVITNPVSLFKELSHTIVHPFANIQVWGMTTVLSLFLMFGYFVILQLAVKPNIQTSTV